MPVRQAVILCGGKGTRLGERVRDLPKPMIPVGGQPVLDHVVATLVRAGIERFILAAGYRGEVIARHYAGSPVSGCTIDVVIEREPLGTAGALRGCADRLDDGFVLAYGDVFIDFDAGRLIAAHESHHPMGTLLVRASDHPWDSHLVVADELGRVSEFVHRRQPDRRYRNIANAAVYVLSRQMLEFIPSDRPSDFGADVFPAVLQRGETLRIHHLEEEAFVKDMGTPERLAAVEEYLAERSLAATARAEPQPIDTVFLDRDGVLNADSGLIDRPERLEMLPGAAEAVALLHRHGIRCIVITNQPVIARGLCSETMLVAIHDQLHVAIRAAGGEVASIYHCPHHPETHHAEGVPELRRACRCRKPAPGLLFRACRDLHLDLRACVMAGDRASDVRAGRAAGVHTVLLGPPDHRVRERALAPADAEFDSLLAFARAVVDRGLFRR